MKRMGAHGWSCSMRNGEKYVGLEKKCAIKEDKEEEEEGET